MRSSHVSHFYVFLAKYRRPTIPGSATEGIDKWQNFTFIMQGGQNVRDCHPHFLTKLLPSENISGG